MFCCFCINNGRGRGNSLRRRCRIASKDIVRNGLTCTQSEPLPDIGKKSWLFHFYIVLLNWCCGCSRSWSRLTRRRHNRLRWCRIYRARTRRRNGSRRRRGSGHFLYFTGYNQFLGGTPTTVCFQWRISTGGELLEVEDENGKKSHNILEWQLRLYQDPLINQP